ncbi:hypothetical protein BDZ94DRAFT_1247490 [Collybia nuda]|uniref:Uncharacterized protein n=1 Tax=Collybia nuda TaxID=64659 RepID=A0A9P6CJ95_9AGAR|nr:hypothetical protein BDZ94DRAFT_1247490 [Collybia nuda]
MYQIPQAANDPLTYTFSSLTQYRAFAGLVYAAALHVYFESEYTHTQTFAIVWWKSTIRSNDSIWNTWVMLSLPAASTLWALISYLLAILAFVFRPPAPALDDYPMPSALNTSLKVIVTASIVSDVVCLACTWMTLKGYRDKYYATCGDI